MRNDLRVDDLGGFLEEPVVAVLATLRRDGSVLLSPVWHEWRDGGFNVWTSPDDVKARHLRRDPRATIVVAGSSPPLPGVELRGSVTFVHDDAHETAVRIATRYLGAERGPEYVDSLPGGDVVLRLEPGDLRVWDFRDDYPDA